MSPHIAVVNTLPRPVRVWVRPPAGPDDGITIPPVRAAEPGHLLAETKVGDAVVRCIVTVAGEQRAVDPTWIGARP